MKKIMRLAILNMLSLAIIGCLTIPESIAQTTVSLKLAKESKHFAFYSTPGDIGVLDSIAATLESNYSRITNRLGIEIEKKTTVKVFPDLTSFHTAIKYPDAPDWVVGVCINDELLMVSPLNPGSMHTYKSLMQVVVHEFVHIAVYYARNGKESAPLPRWLAEGYAQYEAGQINDHIRNIVKSSLKDKTPPTWAQLDAASDMEFGQMNGYGITVMIVEFLVSKYGIDKLVMLIKAPEKMESIYGVSQAELERQWVEYLKS
jgi:hypothetical protein